MKAILFTLFVCLLISCKKNVPIEKISVIDNFVLGKLSSNIPKQMDSLSIQHKRFCTKLVLSEFDDLINENNFINMYFSNTFNLSSYRGRNENLSLLYPVTLTGTNNVIGMILLFGHTTDPWFFGDTQKHKSSFSEKVFVQDINENLIDDIKNLYISKYGAPADTFSMTSHKFYQIVGNQINDYGDPDRKGLHLSWKTEYLNISFFTGLPSYNSRYSLSERSYQESYHLFGDYVPIHVDPLKNELQCFSYCYIEYELNEKAINELNLNKKNF